MVEGLERRAVVTVDGLSPRLHHLDDFALRGVVRDLVAVEHECQPTRRSNA